MTSILVYIELRDDEVQPVSYELLATARSLAPVLNAQVEAVIFGALSCPISVGLGAADRILHMEHPSLARYTPEGHEAALAEVVRQRNPIAVLLGYTAVGLDLGPGLSIKTERPFVSYCVSLIPKTSALVAESQIYGGKILAVTETPLPGIFALVPGVYREENGRVAGSPEVVPVQPPSELDRLATRFVSESRPHLDGVDLTRAERILCVGRGIGGPDQIAEAEEVARLLHAEIAGSRPVIDNGWLPKARQVGKSGCRVSPKFYLAVGVSGAPEHLEGMASSELIIAVNSDPHAPIFASAHYGTTCDLFELLPALSEQLKT
jgi:electron transfer flavoprotein alpha subunit